MEQRTKCVLPGRGRAIEPLLPLALSSRRTIRRRPCASKSVTHAARFIAERGVEKGGPLLVRFIAQVASRFGTVVTQKLAAQAIPVIGAVGGAAVNYAFIEHFQEVARGHFAIRRLERVYGKDPVRQEYERFAARG